jgi:hypothetical protein
MTTRLHLDKSYRHRWLEEFPFVASRKTILKQFSAFLDSHKRLSQENRESQLRLKKKSRNYSLFMFGRKNFTCRRVDAFLGSDENKFHNDENSQLATIKRTSSADFSVLNRNSESHETFRARHRPRWNSDEMMKWKEIGQRSEGWPKEHEKYLESTRSCEMASHEIVRCDRFSY